MTEGIFIRGIATVEELADIITKNILDIQRKGVMIRKTDAAMRLGVTYPTLVNWINKGILAEHPGGRVKLNDVEFLKENPPFRTKRKEQPLTAPAKTTSYK